MCGGQRDVLGAHNQSAMVPGQAGIGYADTALPSPDGVAAPLKCKDGTGARA
nr:hypothetical protein [Arthrobacter polaris]